MPLVYSGKYKKYGNLMKGGHNKFSHRRSTCGGY